MHKARTVAEIGLETAKKGIKVCHCGGECSTFHAVVILLHRDLGQVCGDRFWVCTATRSKAKVCVE